MSQQVSSTRNSHDRGGKLRSLGAFVLAHRRRTMLVWLVLFIVGGIGAQSVQQRLDVQFALPGEPGYEVARDIERQYGNAGAEIPPTLLVAPAPEGQTAQNIQPQFAAAIQDARNRFPTVRIVDYTSTGNPAFITRDGKATWALMFVPLPTSFTEELPSKQVADALAQSIPGTTVTPTGINELTMPTDEDPSGGVFVETMIAGLGALAVLAYVFASFLAIIPLMVAAVSIMTTLLIVLGVTYVADVSFIVLFLVSLVGLGVAIDYSLLVVSRWREERSKGADNETAIGTAMATAGHAVLLSGLTVAIGLLALIVLPVPSLRSIGYGGMLIPLISTAVTLTLLPAILGGFGKKLNWPDRKHEEKPSRLWTGWARLVVKQRWVSLIVATAVLVVLTIPVADMKVGSTDSGSLTQSGAAYDSLKQLTDGGVPTGALTPIEVLTSKESAPAVATRLRSVEGMSSAFISDAPDSNRGGTTVVVALPAMETSNSSNTDPVKDARDAVAGMPGVVGLTGQGAIQLDYLEAVYGNALLVFVIIALFTFILLVRAFHSVLLAVKALVLNIVSLAAIFGVLTWFWQQGHGSESIFDVAATGSITFWIPTMVFAFLFGLSMDYEVFIIARMREEYDESGSTAKAVIVGIGRTGRLVTSAALILFMSFASLALSGFTDLKVLATGLGAGILLDATIIRAFLLPALVALFGEWNWWMPRWLAVLLRTEIPAKVTRTDSDSDPTPAVTA